MRKQPFLPLPALICSEDRRGGCVQAGGKGCISAVSWPWTLGLKNWPALSCFWTPVRGFLLCLLARVQLQKSLWDVRGKSEFRKTHGHGRKHRFVLGGVPSKPLCSHSPPQRAGSLTLHEHTATT